MYSRVSYVLSSIVVLLNTFILMGSSLHGTLFAKHYLKTVLFCIKPNVSNTNPNELSSFEMLKDLIAVFLFSNTPLNQLEAGH